MAHAIKGAGSLWTGEYPQLLRCGFCAEIAFAMYAHADGIGFHVAFADHEHGVDFHLLGGLDLRGICLSVIPSEA